MVTFSLTRGYRHCVTENVDLLLENVVWVLLSSFGSGEDKIDCYYIAFGLFLMPDTKTHLLMFKKNTWKNLSFFFFCRSPSHMCAYKVIWNKYPILCKKKRTTSHLRTVYVNLTKKNGKKNSLCFSVYLKTNLYICVQYSCVHV